MQVLTNTGNTVLVPRIEGRIQVIRGLRVMIDVDLAALYGVPTKRLNEQVKRNRERFPADFLVQLNATEKAEVVANCDHLQKLKFFKVLPYAFTEHGAIQAANVLDAVRELTSRPIHPNDLSGSSRRKTRRTTPKAPPQGGARRRHSPG